MNVSKKKILENNSQIEGHAQTTNQVVLLSKKGCEPKIRFQHKCFFFFGMTPITCSLNCPFIVFSTVVCFSHDQDTIFSFF